MLLKIIEKVRGQAVHFRQGIHQLCNTGKYLWYDKDDTDQDQSQHQHIGKNGSQYPADLFLLNFQILFHELTQSIDNRVHNHGNQDTHQEWHKHIQHTSDSICNSKRSHNNSDNQGTQQNHRYRIDTDSKITVIRQELLTLIRSGWVFG